jgi:hypothetical protein
MIFACGYTYFIVPFSLALEYDITLPWLIPIDVITLLIFLIDIPISSKIALNKSHEITLSLREIEQDYVDSRLVFDLLGVMPLDYFLWGLGAS